MRVLVCGGRDFGNDGPRGPEVSFIVSTLHNYATKWDPLYPDPHYLPEGITVITGDARGVDRAAIDWAIVNWMDFHEFKANWKEHGKAAGYIRNQQMLDEGKPDLVIAFPGGKGTADMVRRAKKAGVPVEIVEYP